jgi:hypothetical protein
MNGADGRIALKAILNENDVMMWTRFVWLRYDPVASSCEHGNEISVSI